MTALVTVSDTASATAAASSSEAPAAEAKAAAERRICPTADGTAVSVQPALDAFDAGTVRDPRRRATRAVMPMTPGCRPAGPGYAVSRIGQRTRGPELSLGTTEFPFGSEGRAASANDDWRSS